MSDEHLTPIDLTLLIHSAEIVAGLVGDGKLSLGVMVGGARHPVNREDLMRATRKMRLVAGPAFENAELAITKAGRLALAGMDGRIH